MVNYVTLKVVLESSDEGGFTAYVPALPGCISEGETRDEAMANIREAIAACLEARAANGMPLSSHVQ